MAFYYAENKQLHKIIYTLLDVCASFFIGETESSIITS